MLKNFLHLPNIWTDKAIQFCKTFSDYIINKNGVYSFWNDQEWPLQELPMSLNAK